MGIVNGRRHQFGRLPYRVPDHHPLVACANLFGACFTPHFKRGIDTISDVRRLLFDRYHHAGRFGIEP